jgi:4-amino-4-deoxychorismate lyase
MDQANPTFLSEADCVARLRERPRVPGPTYVYSTLIGGWTESPLGLLVALDDHGFHRGDGAFEAIRIANRKPYLLLEHWERLQRSLARLGIPAPMDFSSLERIVQAGVDRFPEANGALRLFVTRGPGGFAADFRECLAPQFFAVLCKFKQQAEEKYRVGVRLGRSAVPVKPEWLANTKSLNYLPNVMMKKESVEAGFDFTVAFDENGIMAESATENVVIITRDGHLAHPPLNRILRGCTMARLFELAEREKILPTRRGAELREDDLRQAQGAYMVGTPFDVLPVREYCGQAIPLSPLGPVLRDLIRKDQGVLPA